MHDGRDGATDSIGLDTVAIPDSARAVVLAASVTGHTFGSVNGLALTIIGSDAEEIRIERAASPGDDVVVLGRIDRRGDGWEVTAGGPGWGSRTGRSRRPLRCQRRWLPDQEPAAGAAEEEPMAAAAAPATAQVAPESGSEPESVLATKPAPAPAPEPSAGSDLGLDEPAAPPPVAALDVYAAAVLPEPEHGAAERLPRLRVSHAGHHGATTFDSAPLTLPLGESIRFIRGGEPSTEHFWLRVSCTSAGPTSEVDVGALTYDAVGDVREIVDHQNPGAANGAIGLVNRPVGADADTTAAVEMRLDAVAPDARGIVVGVTNYRGTDLSALDSIITDLVDESGRSWSGPSAQARGPAQPSWSP